MAEFYDEPMPVRIVDEDFGDRSEILFRDALPVLVTNPSEGGGGGSDYVLPGRLGEVAEQIPDGTDVRTITKSGWYYGNSIKTGAGNGRQALVEVVIGKNGDWSKVVTYDIQSLDVHLVTRKNGTDSAPWRKIADGVGGVDSTARDQMRYTTWTYLDDSWNGYWNSLPDVRDRVLELDLSYTGSMTLDDVPDLDSDRSATIDLIVYQAESGPMLNLGWPSNVIWPDGTAPNVTATAGAIDRFRLTKISRGWLGEVVGRSYAQVAE